VSIEDISLFLDNQASPKTSSTYKWCLERWFAFLGDREPTEAIALQFKAHLESGGLKSRSASNVFNTIRAFYRFMGGYNAFERLRAPRKVENDIPRVPEDSLVDKMLEMCDDIRDRAILLLLLCGLRASEVTNLTRESISWSETYDMDILTVIGKGNVLRLVPLPPDVSNAVRKYDETLSPTRSWLFERWNGEKMNLKAIQVVVVRYSKKAGKEIRPHALRHHYATRLIHNGVDIRHIQVLLGHKNIQSTQIYTRLDLSDIVGAVRRDPMHQPEGDKNDE
jgi:integrase/recombinase XerD